MELREAVQQVLKVQRDAMSVSAAEAAVADEPDEALGELVVAEYIVFLLALDTYIRWVEEATGQQDPTDDVIDRGIRLLRQADAELASIRAFFDANLTTPTHKKMLAKYLNLRATNSEGVGRRAWGLRTILSRGGAATMRAIFETNRALQEVRLAINASMLDDADAALDLFAKISFRNTRLRAWVDLAAKTAVPISTLPANVVEAGSKEAQDQKTEMLAQGVEQLAASGADASQQAQIAHTEKILQVQQEATAAARKSMDQAGEPDEPLTKSETVGVAVAAATAAVSDPSNPSNIPVPLRKLDDEQRAAALTDGRVLVAAGAGAGKSTTLVARVRYLLEDRRVNPSRVLVTSFNKKAANELAEKITTTTGLDLAQSGMLVGTTHSLFRAFITDNGDPDEQVAMSSKQPSGFVGDGSVVARAVQKIWEECFDSRVRPTPKLKAMKLHKSLWAGNDISPAEARTLAKTKEEVDAADWYEMYEGLKGGIPGWQPPCEAKAKDRAEEEYQERLRSWRNKGSNPRYRPNKPGTTYEAFMTKTRKGGMRLGDFEDMIKWFRDILKRNPGARKEIQKRFDHILVDECQDLNSTQHEAFALMTEHVTDGSDGKSLWMVGDDKQSIYQFRGARPDLFTGLHQKEGWKTRMIKTNYRCEPEIVEVANKLIAHNEGQIPMDARPAPTRSKGVGSIRLETPPDDATAAIDAVERIKSGSVGLDDVGKTQFYAKNAVLARTNAELHSFETACIIRGVPYARKGSGSFLGAPETEAVLGYVELIMGADAEAMQKAFGKILNRPNRFWLAPKDSEEIVKDAIREYARYAGSTIKSVNPVSALRDSRFQEILAEAIVRKKGKGSSYGYSRDLSKMSGELDEIQAMTSEPGFTTENLFNAILALKGKGQKINPDTGRSEFVDQSFREALQLYLRDKDTGEDDEEEEGTEEALLGNISFLYKLAEVDPTDEADQQNPPTTPNGFQAKIDRFRRMADDLRIDLNEWEKKNPGKPPPAVYLGTVHSVKGAQWQNCFVQMPKGKFPIEKQKKDSEEGVLPSPEELEKEQQERESERRLAYVALTRAAVNLTVICPAVVGGRKAGVSQFADEAGLTLGENVQKPNAGGAVPELPTDPTVKEASIDFSEGPYEVAGEAPWNPEA